MRVWTGTSGFSYPEWKGKFYPKGLPAKKMLSFYSGRFPTVEINASFYRMPSPETVAAWTHEVPDEFRFILKAPQQITHRERLKGSEETLARFVEVSQQLGSRKGPFLFQLPPFFKVDVARLQEFLALVPKTERVAFEFRHVSWFCDETYTALREANAALCVADSEKLTTPFVATTNWGYLRLRDLEYDDAALRQWAKQVQAQSWTEAFVFFKHEESGKGPELGRRFQAMVA